MSAQVFVSHSSKDHKLAMAICTALEQRGCPCWISSRDIGAGENFQEAIVGAIRTARAMILVFSRNANDSAEIKKELALASEYGLVVIPVRAEDVIPTGAFKYELSTRQWIDLFQNWDQAILRLAEQIERIGGGGAATGPSPMTRTGPRGLRLSLAIVAAGLVIAGAVLFFLRPELVIGSRPGGNLRAAGVSLTNEEIDAALVKHDLFDARRNAAGKGVKHRYAAQVIGSVVVVGDPATALMWQRNGSAEELTRPEAAAYVDRLNAEKHGGFADWRLPTMEEAMSLVEPQVSGACHIDAVFQRPPFFVWTADRAPGEKRGIVIYFCDGALASESENFHARVRAVRGL